MIKRKFRKQQTAGNFPKMETTTLKSETIPDQSMSIREIMTRFANGTLDDISTDYPYTEDLPDIRGLDIVERDQMLSQARHEAKEARENVAKSAEENREIKRKIKENQEKVEDAKIVE